MSTYGGFFDPTDEDFEQAAELMARKKKRKFGSYGWHPMFVVEWRWRRVGLGVELSLGDWSPAEIAIYFNLFGLLIGVGVEENFPDDFR